MILFALTISLMVLAVAIAVVPLIVAMVWDAHLDTSTRTAESALTDAAARPHTQALAA